ncbi:MAG: hypothetical protein ACYS5V_11175 [Planctomycetota bacterium]|jgi:hypothetical protein
MKRTIIAILLLLALTASAGCGGVILSPRYSRLLDDTAAISAETARRAEAGDLSAEEMARALSRQADVWRKFQQARDGEAGR